MTERSPGTFREHEAAGRLPYDVVYDEDGTPIEPAAPGARRIPAVDRGIARLRQNQRMSDAEARPWGRFEVLSDTDSHKVKRLTVDPGHRLSYQRHVQRSEHWFVVAGEGVVTLDGASHPVTAGTAIDIPAGSTHRIQNSDTEPLVFIEVQHGTYFGEDDIERLAHDYGRLDPN